MHYINTKIVSALIIIFIFSVSAFISPAQAENHDNNIGFLLTDKHGELLLSKNIDKPLIPASILKIVTSLAAISYLGEDYKYQTLFYYNKQNSNLYIKGFADPLFVSEEINKASSLLSAKLENIKINSINDIILDHSFFEDQIKIPGKSNTLNPYDAYQGALCANFNTVFFKTDNITNILISAEDQTPLLPIFEQKIIATKLKQGRIILSKTESMTYPGLLIKYFLKENGIKTSGKILLGKLPKKKDTEEQPFLIYTSTVDLKKIIQNLLEYSNNFIGNQVLLTLGAHVSGSPSNLKKSVKVVNSYLLNNFQDNKIKYVEGSGISRENRISCKSMIKILIKFMPYHTLMKKDDKGFYKTGTLSGIRTRAGYIRGKNGSLYPYVIMVNMETKDYKNILNKMKQRVKRI